jgi:hypothetical protein
VVIAGDGSGNPGRVDGPEDPPFRAACYHDVHVRSLRPPQSAGVIELDHVILGVPDLDAAARRLEEEHRLPSVPGGRHEGLGTENRIVPLGDAYVELMGVADRDEAAANPLGRWLLDRVAAGETWLGWCLRTGDLDGVCARLGLSAVAMSRTRPDGVELRWRLAGLEAARDESWRPFFIEWNVPDDDLPGRAGGQVQASGARIAAVEVGADEAALRDWVGELPGTVRPSDGPPGVHAVAVAGTGGMEVLRPAGS